MKKALLTLASALSIISLVPALASAHVVVTPASAGIGSEQVYSVSVPNEKRSAVTNVKLLIPTEVTAVTPTAKDGWIISATRSGDNISAITWTGLIPVGQRDDFSFSATAPAKAIELDWKAYQTYADGSVIHWDQKPAGSDDATGDAGPYSVTSVINDLSGSKPTATTSADTWAIALSIVAVLVSVVALAVQMGRR